MLDCNEPSTGVAVAEIEDARRAKWARGAAEHGPIMAFDPLDELFNEMLDGTNYSETLTDDPRLADDRELVVALASQLRRCARVVRYLQKKHIDKPWVPGSAQFK